MFFFYDFLKGIVTRKLFHTNVLNKNNNNKVLLRNDKIHSNTTSPKRRIQYPYNLNLRIEGSQGDFLSDLTIKLARSLLVNRPKLLS
jgi:hypothetical protein